VRILPRETKDQFAERTLKPRSPGPPVRVRPPARDQLPVPAKLRLRPERECRLGRPRERAAWCQCARSARVNVGREAFRPRIAKQQSISAAVTGAPHRIRAA
jgi:hypothetical protein